MDSDTRKCGIHYYAGMVSYDMPSPELYTAFCDWVRGELAREFHDHNIVVIDDLVIARIVNIPGQGAAQQWLTDDDANHERIYQYCDSLLPRWLAERSDNQGRLTHGRPTT